MRTNSAFRLVEMRCYPFQETQVFNAYTFYCQFLFSTSLISIWWDVVEVKRRRFCLEFSIEIKFSKLLWFFTGPAGPLWTSEGNPCEMHGPGVWALPASEAPQGGHNRPKKPLHAWPKIWAGKLNTHTSVSICNQLVSSAPSYFKAGILTLKNGLTAIVWVVSFPLTSLCSPLEHTGS